jgi:hypothetical protein
MNGNTIDTTVIEFPLPTLEDQQLELSWKILYMEELIWEFLDYLERIKEEYEMNVRPIPSPNFDPFKTIGKY